MSIGLRGTARKIVTTSAITLNCASGPDWSVLPQPTDDMMVIVYYCDDSGLPQFNGPISGWTLIRSQSFVATAVVYQIWYRIASASEATYTWTAVNNGQSGQVFILHGMGESGAFTGIYNPNGADPLPFAKINQTGALTQTAPTATMTAASSALMAAFAMDSTAQHYTSLDSINGVNPSVAFFDSFSVISSGMSVGTGLWLASGVGTWTPTAHASGTLGSWGAVKWGVRQQPPPTPIPIPTGPYGSALALPEFTRQRRRRWLRSPDI